MVKEYLLNNNKNKHTILAQIDKRIEEISKISIQCDIMNWFQQSPLHWLMGLFVMKYYYLNSDLSKQELVEEINKHVPIDGKKTITTEFRYIEDCEKKKYITTLPSFTDHRKKIVRPTLLTIKSFEEWFENNPNKLENIFDQPQSLSINN
tara:strand:- start:1466 stop:1915 length:450 start_codon:yes stop_codon:yes gene_type:complete